MGSNSVKPAPEYLPDETVDEGLDQEIRTLLTTCFTKPQDVVFRERRYFREPYPHRWIIRNEQGVLVAHIGVHEKKAEADGVSYRVGGICEVCVHPDCRGKGYVRQMLEAIHTWLAAQGYAFTCLFGDPKVYSSSGYFAVSNLYNGGGEKDWLPANGMVNTLSDTPWPSGKVLMPGPGF